MWIWMDCLYWIRILVHFPYSKVGTAGRSHDVLNILFEGQSRRVLVGKSDIFAVGQNVERASCNRDCERLSSIAKVGPARAVSIDCPWYLQHSF